MNTHSTLPLPNRPTVRQRSLRCRSGRLSLEEAVRVAVDAFFGFKYCAPRTGALWCETEHVWLGSETFLYWALSDSDIDIPWVVATAVGAPPGADDLREAVRAELTSYWGDRMRCLPRMDHPRWLPLP